MAERLAIELLLSTGKFCSAYRLRMTMLLQIWTCLHILFTLIQGHTVWLQRQVYVPTFVLQLSLSNVKLVVYTMLTKGLLYHPTPSEVNFFLIKEQIPKSCPRHCRFWEHPHCVYEWCDKLSFESTHV